MKLKFTLQRSDGPSVDLIATVDATTTVGDLARHLAATDPEQHATPGQGPVTLGVLGRRHLTLDPRLPVGDSGLRSGATLTISRGGMAFTQAQAAPAAAVVRVVAGPDAGREFPLARGTATIGRERGCEVRLTDGMVSRQHARLNITDAAEIVDLGSSNGVLIGEAVVPRSALRPGDVVRVGETELAVHLIRESGAARAVDGPSVAFVRSPRLDPRFTGVGMQAPEPPERPTMQRFPLIPLLAPLAMGAVLYLVTRSTTSLIFIGLSPVLMLGNAIESRLVGRAAFAKAVEQWRADVADLIEEATAAAAAEVAARMAEHPSTAECIQAVERSTPLLWARRPGEHGFAEVRLGLGRQPSRNTIEVGTNRRSPRDLVRELTRAAAPFAVVDGVPVVARPADGALGLAGARPGLLTVTRALVAQAAALHSPAELVIAGFASAATARDWDWLKWLPHSSSVHAPLSARLLASSPAGCAELASELEDLLDRRAADRHADAAVPAVVVLVEDDAPADHSRLVDLAERGGPLGVHVWWLAADTTLLPAACRTFLEVAPDPGTGLVGYVHSGQAVRPVALEQLGDQPAFELAKRLAPLVDAGARVEDDSDLPRTVSLLAMTGIELATSADAVIERWLANRSIVTARYAARTAGRRAGTLRAVVGQSAAGPLALDLRADGPHALVGGTTGSGKSELLQAWILGMAAAHSPQRVTFLLVDYKGGSAFRDCVDLPHTVGLVTDLSGHLVRRALTSLSAELRYREHVLAAHKAKDLLELERSSLEDVPPSLVIVVDEFAALVQEVPDFVDGVVDVAQRGRSLGLHLILATQRPAGVIKDNLRANTNLRLALRMADESDSTDVLGSAQAASFDPALPGRAVAKTGPGRLVTFQAGYAGGWTTAEPPPAEIHVEQLSFGAGPVWQLEQRDNTPVTDLGPTDIQRMVRTIRGASAAAELPVPRKPWLPALPAACELANIPTARRDTDLVFGLRDDPAHQSQPTVAFQPDRDGHLAVYGTGGSGKSTLLRTLAVAAGYTIRGGPCHVYGIDFGSRGLAMLEELPHVGSIIPGSDHERITRLLGWLRELIDERALRYSRVNAATIADYRRLAGAPDEPRILLLVDGIPAFRQAYEASDRVRWFDMFTGIVADGRPVGVHAALATDQRGGLSTALASAVQRRVVMRMASAEDYGMLGVPADVLQAQAPPGRCLIQDAEVQVAVLSGSADLLAQATAIRGLAESMRRAGVAPAPPIRSLPDRIPLTLLPSAADGMPVIGMSAATLEAVAVQPRGTFIVSGPPGSGRTTALHTLAAALRGWRSDARLHYFGPRRSPLASLNLWDGRSCGGTEAAGAARLLAAEISLPAATGPPYVVVIEGIADFLMGEADIALQELVRQCLAEDHFVIAEGEATTMLSPTGLLGLVKASRRGIALQPDAGDGSQIYRTQFPRINRAEFPPGRGLLVGGGGTTVIQVATAGDAMVG